MNGPDITAHRALWLSGALLAVSLFLQRFGLPLGGKGFDIVGPIGLGLMAFGLMNGALCFHRIRLITFLVFLALIMLGLVWHASEPGAFAGPIDLDSLTQFLALTSFATVTFATPVEEAAFFRTVTFLFMLVAIAGIVQFLLQFAGIRVFAFTGLLPEKLLFEYGYNLVIPVGVAGLFKSNGFFLVEPSVFSQIMALSIIIEATAFRRMAYLAAFIAGLMLSFSGTGWIVLGAFVAGSALAMGRRGLVIAFGVVFVLAVILGAMAVLAPDIVASLSDRLGEFSQPGTSGYLRFVTPFRMMSDVFSLDPGALLLGIGAGRSEQLTLPYAYAVNTPVKVMVEYGVPALVAYTLLFVLGRKTPVQAALVLPAVVLFMFTGGYQQFAPMIFIVLLLSSVAHLE